MAGTTPTPCCPPDPAVPGWVGQGTSAAPGWEQSPSGLVPGTGWVTALQREGGRALGAPLPWDREMPPPVVTLQGGVTAPALG